MHRTLCNYMITNDPDKIVMGVHWGWYLMLIYDVVLSVLISFLNDVWNFWDLGELCSQAKT